jgi:hypothetical protein
VKRGLKNGLEPPKLRGRHNALVDDSEANTLAWIQHKAEKSQSLTGIDMVSYSVNRFGKSITLGWMDSFLIRRNNDLTETVSNLQENLHRQVPQEFLVATICGMEEALQGSVRDLLFDLDEVGVSD